MRVEHTDQIKLLRLQEADLRISRLGHQMASNPLHSKLQELAGRADDLRRSVVAQKVDLADRQRHIDNVEGEVSKVEQRRRIQQERLDSGKVGIRDMSAVEHEIKKIVERKEQLELEVLELQEELEKREAFLEKTEAAALALAQDEAQTREQLVAEAGVPAAELEEAQAEAEMLRRSLPEAVIDEYDHFRQRTGVLAVLRFEDGRLVNAPIELTMEELGSLTRAPEDELWESEDWGYLVVRV